MKKHRVIYEKDVKHSVSTPMELNPVIDTILEYGRKTHALGALRACETLKMIAKELKTINRSNVDEQTNVKITNTIKKAEEESKKTIDAIHKNI